MPCPPSAIAVVTTVTPVANRPSAFRNARESTLASAMPSTSAEFRCEHGSLGAGRSPVPMLLKVCDRLRIHATSRRLWLGAPPPPPRPPPSSTPGPPLPAAPLPAPPPPQPHPP